MNKPESSEKIMVCIGSGTSGARLVTAAAKMADRMRAKWIAVHVETPKEIFRSEAEQNRAIDGLRLAEQLGAETHIIAGRDIAEHLMTFARERNITRIVAGKPGSSGISGLFKKSPLDRLLRISGSIPVEITEGDETPSKPVQPSWRTGPSKFRWSDYGTGLMYLLIATGLCFLMYPYFHLDTLIMAYLLAVLVTSIDCGRGPGIFASGMSVLAFDFLFVPPRWSFTVEDAQYIFTFAVMFVVSVTISHLASGMRRLTLTARMQERQTSAMHDLTRKLASSRSISETLRIAVGYISEIFDARVAVLLPDGTGKLRIAAGGTTSVFEKDFAMKMDIAREAFENGVAMGLGTKSSPGAGLACIPLQVADAVLGVVVIRPADHDRLLAPDQHPLLESLVKQVALSLEFEYLVENRAVIDPGALDKDARSGEGAVLEN